MIRISVLIAATALSTGAVAQTGPTPAQQGETLALRWCASCHAIGPDDGMATDAAPAFVTVAQTRSDAELADWLAAPHAPMPDPGLNRAQIDALVAHIATLRETENGSD